MKRSFILLLVLAAAYIGGAFLIDRWEVRLHRGDSFGYYLHLVSAFVYDDVGDYSRSIGSLLEINPLLPDMREDEFGIRLTEHGRRYIKYSLGVPLLELPFFLAAHAWASATGTWAANGWTWPYMLLVGLSPVFYILLGFALLLPLLRRWFSGRVTVLVALTLGLATNLFYQGTYETMAHGFLFFEYCLLLRLTLYFWQQPGPWRAMALGASVGLIALTRVPEVVSLLLPLLWGVEGKTTLRHRLQWLRRHTGWLLLAAAGLLAVFSVQLAYWHYVSGQLIFDPYTGENFNFLRPHIWSAWFSFRNGWLIYTPVMVFSLAGWWLLPRYVRGARAAIGVVVGLHLWIHYSYYAWTYFPGLGQRPMVEMYPLLALGLGAAFTRLRQSGPWLRQIPTAALILCALLNLFQTWQMREGVIWPERGNAAFYGHTFGRMQPTLRSLRAWDTAERQPDSSGLNRVATLYTESYDTVRAGRTALLTRERWTILADTIPVAQVPSRAWLRVAVQAYMPSDQPPFHRDVSTSLIVELYDPRGIKRKGRAVMVPGHLGNPHHSIWHSGRPNHWDEAAFFMRLPRQAGPGWRLRVFLDSPAGQYLYIDELKVEVWN